MRTFRMRTSRSAVLRTCSSSSDSLNFLMATICPVSLWRALRTMPYVLPGRQRRVRPASLVRGGGGSARTPRRSYPAPRSSPSSRVALDDRRQSLSTLCLRYPEAAPPFCQRLWQEFAERGASSSGRCRLLILTKHTRKHTPKRKPASTV